MSARALAGVPQRLWERAAAARHRLLMLDYDGTLAPFRIDRDQAHPLPAALAALEAIAAVPGGTQLAIVSGRPVRALEQLLGPLRATLVGEHGWEMRVPGEERVEQPLPSGAGETLGRAARAADEL
ncbi:MAG TPA: trehalose-phosphatase, partial [Candidatus Polarisedimenticolaceae bacterium]|nr:trehalose-phosphatase [Candidatus Polarisedimenticolaceae bacterium]